MTMTREEAAKYLRDPANKGKVVPITFLKSDGSVRRMDVLIGGDPSILVNDDMKKAKPKPEGIVGVYDNAIKQYRSLHRDNLLAVTIDGANIEFPPIQPKE